MISNKASQTQKQVNNSSATRVSRLFESPWLPVFILAVFLIIVIYFFPGRTSFEFSTDEGINLMKAMLVDRGYELYQDIWSDQPPLFTYALASVLHFVGFKVGAGRFLILGFSCILLLAAYQYIKIVWDQFHALIGVALIFLLPKYMMLSVSVMIGLPAIALAMLSMLTLTMWHVRRSAIWIILSAVLLSLSVLTKLFTGLLAPIFVAGIIAEGYFRLQEKRRWWPILQPAVLWGIFFAAFVVIVGVILVKPGNIGQLLETHLGARSVEVFHSSIYTLLPTLYAARQVLFLAVIGAILALRSRRWLSLYAIAWTVTAFLILFRHVPIWDHHQLLITIPAAILASGAVYEMLRVTVRVIRSHFDMSWNSLLAAASVLGVLAFLFTFRVHEPYMLIGYDPTTSLEDLRLGPLEERFLVRMRKFAPETNWVVTDLPMYAFRANLLVPPEVAVFSQKRYRTGELTELDVVDVIREYQPEQVLLGRFEYFYIKSQLKTDYRLVHVDDLVELYVRNDIGR